MNFFIALYRYLKCMIFTRSQLWEISLLSPSEKDLELLAHRSQNALFQNQVINNKRPKPMPTPEFRQAWIFLYKRYGNWKENLFVYKPETVVKWHRLKFKELWAKRSK